MRSVERRKDGLFISWRKKLKKRGGGGGSVRLTTLDAKEEREKAGGKGCILFFMLTYIPTGEI